MLSELYVPINKNNTHFLVARVRFDIKSIELWGTPLGKTNQIRAISGTYCAIYTTKVSNPRISQLPPSMCGQCSGPSKTDQTPHPNNPTTTITASSRLCPSPSWHRGYPFSQRRTHRTTCTDAKTDAVLPTSSGNEEEHPTWPSQTSSPPCYNPADKS